MSNPEIKVGQKYCVVDAQGFSYPRQIGVGEIVEVTSVSRDASQGEVRVLPEREILGTIYIDLDDITCGFVELVDEFTGAPSTDTPEEVESSSQESTGTPQEILNAAHACVGVSRSSVDSSEGIRMYKNTNHNSDKSGQSAELLWKFIEGSSEYNGHKSLEVGELSFESLKDIVKGLEYYLEEDEDTTASSLEIRLMYNGDFLASLKGTWCASVYQLDYWKTDEHPCGHTDRLLLSVEKVVGI